MEEKEGDWCEYKMVIGARKRERFDSILSYFLHGIKTKGYDVIGVRVFVPSLMRFLPKKE